MKRSKRQPAEIYTADEIRKMLRSCGRGATGVRNRALVVILWRAGLRVAEALALEPKDADLEKGTFRILHGKGDRSRTVAADPEACAVVSEWVRKRAEIVARRKRGKRAVPLFCTLEGGPLQPSYVRQFLPRLGKRAGVAKRVHAHGLRHTFAVELVREGHSLPVVCAALGHANVATTHRYIAHLEMPELVDALRSREGWWYGRWFKPPQSEVVLRGRARAPASPATTAARTTSSGTAKGRVDRKSAPRSGRGARSAARVARRSKAPAARSRPKRSRRSRRTN